MKSKLQKLAGVMFILASIINIISAITEHKIHYLLIAVCYLIGGFLYLIKPKRKV